MGMSMSIVSKAALRSGEISLAIISSTQQITADSHECSFCAVIGTMCGLHGLTQVIIHMLKARCHTLLRNLGYA